MVQPMNYTTIVSDIFSRFPELEAVYHTNFAYMENEEPAPYVIFGSILIPALTEGLERGDLGMILPLCAFLEDVSLAARQDLSLLGLVKVEIAEWLGWVANEDRLAPWLGPETKRICNYVPGLATQRRQLRAEGQKKTFLARAAALARHLKTRRGSKPVGGVSSTPPALTDKEESRRIRARIRHVLLEVWDPIGVKDEPNAQDEYDGYIGRLYELLVEDAGDAELLRYLYWVAHDRMGFEEAKASDAQATVVALRSIPLCKRHLHSIREMRLEESTKLTDMRIPHNLSYVEYHGVHCCPQS